MAKHFKTTDSTVKTIYLAPCDELTIARDSKSDTTITRSFSNYEDALAYLKFCGWPNLEDSIVRITVGSAMNPAIVP